MAHCKNIICCTECWKIIVPDQTGFFTVMFVQGGKYYVCQKCFGNPDLSECQGDEVNIFQSSAQTCACGKHYNALQKIDSTRKHSITSEGLKRFLGTTHGVHTQFS